MIYKPVTTRADRVLILATGPSVEGVRFDDLAEDVHVIAINGAVEWFGDPDSFFSLDPSYYVRKLLKRPIDGVRYYLAVPDDYGQPNARVYSHRTPADAHVHYLRRIAGDGPWSSCPGLSVDPDAIHTGNSAYGALGLAFHMKPERIAILGVDASVSHYAYSKDRPRQDFSHLPDLFATACGQLFEHDISVINGSLASSILCFPKASPQYAIDWISE